MKKFFRFTMMNGSLRWIGKSCVLRSVRTLLFDASMLLLLAIGVMLNFGCFCSAGFVRNCLKFVTKNNFQFALTDRDFMRAKDFFFFFSTVPYNVMASETIPESDRLLKWRTFTDLRLAIPGDIICYRPKGNAAGGAAFTITDKSDLNRLLKAVKTSELWHDEGAVEWNTLVTRNIAKDPEVKAWSSKIKVQLTEIGIRNVPQLRSSLSKLNGRLEAKGYEPLSERTIQLMRECCDTECENTGHLVFVSGHAVRLDECTYRIRVVHSTQNGFKDKATGEITEGVQEYYRKFYLQPDGSWTRTKSPPPTVHESLQMDNDKDSQEDPMDDMEDDSQSDDMDDCSDDAPFLEEDNIVSDDSDANEDEKKTTDELATNVGFMEVIASRMCF